MVCTQNTQELVVFTGCYTLKLNIRGTTSCSDMAIDCISEKSQKVAHQSFETL